MKTFFLHSIFTLLCLLIAQVYAGAQPEFKFHYVDKNLDWLTSAQQTTLSDIDNDGDLDFTAGNVHQRPGLFWHEYKSADNWLLHVIVSDDGFYGGAAAMDVNQDNRVDIISSEYLFINKKGKTWPAAIGWDKYKIGTCDPYCHDMVKADLNRDGKMDLITNSGKNKGEVCAGMRQERIPQNHG